MQTLPLNYLLLPNGRSGQDAFFQGVFWHTLYSVFTLRALSNTQCKWAHSTVQVSLLVSDQHNCQFHK